MSRKHRVLGRRAALRRTSPRTWIWSGIAVVLVVTAISAALHAGAERFGARESAAASPTSVAIPTAALTPAGAASPAPTHAPAAIAAPAAPAAPPVAAAPAATERRDPAAAEGTARALLETLPVKGRAPKTGYAREQFGRAWMDVDHNGCDTRNDILARDLTDITRRDACTILTGTLADPYTGTSIAFVRGRGTSEKVQIDHVVALSDAWQKGAQQLPVERREALANDPINVIAVDGPANEQKGDGDAATWLPRNTAFRCPYVARQITVKAAYGLWVTPAEHDAMATVLANCPDEAAAAPISPSQAASTPAVPADPAPAAPADPAPAAPADPPPAAPAAPAADAFYANCTAVRAAGAAPIHTGDPGYSRRLDRDGDGTGCE